MFYAIGTALSLYVAILLLKNVQETPHRVLLGLLLLWAMRFGLYWFKSSEWLSLAPALVVIDQNLFFLDGPLIWLYVQVVNQKKILRWKTLLHFIPFVLALLHSLQLLWEVSPQQLLATYQRISQNIGTGNYSLSLYEVLFIGAIMLSLMAYGWFSLRELSRYHQHIQSQLSNIEQVRLQWLRRLLVGWMLFLAIPILIFFINYLFGFGRFVLFQQILNTSLIIFVGMVGYFGGNQQYITLPPVHSPQFNESNSSPKTPKEKYQKSGLTIEQIEAMHEVFVEKINTEKWYLQEDLTLTELAQLLEIKPNILSQVINTATQDNFYDFVNRFRVEAVKQLLPHSRESVLQIAYQCGFKSKSTFNACFKKFTGYTPTQYRNSKNALK
ncbi:hypothetical protein BKI52_11500 [marine bacterium AO1-C]|nr:hypothetical protein BKI52_11500 [marine bacterium AO1-C]